MLRNLDFNFILGCCRFERTGDPGKEKSYVTSLSAEREWYSRHMLCLKFAFFDGNSFLEVFSFAFPRTKVFKIKGTRFYNSLTLGLPLAFMTFLHDIPIYLEIYISLYL